MRLPSTRLFRIGSRAALLLGLAPVLAGCGGDLSRAFGFSRSSPNEFEVTTQPPLSMPPTDTIRPPEPGAARPQEVPAAAAAQAALMPNAGASSAAGASPGQQALVQMAGAGQSSGPQLTKPEGQSDETFVHRLLFGGPGEGTLVNPAAEAARLRQNAALGASPAAGPTPTIKPASSGGWLSHIF
ncbi:MAG: DUF3035 domain-containing protein [Rhodospirillales bacterium]|nr:DUF3035 domain-containing protein [Rhodospirillales bacterium]